MTTLHTCELARAAAPDCRPAGGGAAPAAAAPAAAAGAEGSQPGSPADQLSAAGPPGRRPPCPGQPPAPPDSPASSVAVPFHYIDTDPDPALKNMSHFTPLVLLFQHCLKGQ
jgi:hypothetical protein